MCQRKSQEVDMIKSKINLGSPFPQLCLSLIGLYQGMNFNFVLGMYIIKCSFYFCFLIFISFNMDVATITLKSELYSYKLTLFP